MMVKVKEEKIWTCAMFKSISVIFFYSFSYLSTSTYVYAKKVTHRARYRGDD